jgi:hypothetical protein
MIVVVAPDGIGPLGITNSLAPPAVCPPPINPGLDLNTGDANPLSGVENWIT